MSGTSILTNLADTQRLAISIAGRLRCGDVVTLGGDLGAGKTTFAQFLIQALSPQPVEVTSPTFNLLQIYPIETASGQRCELFHYDLYRIEQESALIELGLEEALHGITILEWPERLGSYSLPVTLALRFAFAKDGSRSVAAQGSDGRWGELFMSSLPAIRPERGVAMDAFLARVGWAGAARQMLAGDASFRRYERVQHQNIVAVLMDAPPPWEDVRPFLAVTEQLAACGVTVPKILAADEDQGFLLLEDLGDLSFTALLKSQPARERELYLAATEALITIRRASAHAAQTLKPYDMAVYLREAALFAEWFLPQLVGINRACELREEYLAIWRTILIAAQLQQSCLVHRDYHADNLFWLDDRTGHHAVAMIDYQDALWGDPAYDLASLLEDARRDVGIQITADCFARYTSETGENAQAFALRYAVLAAQRNAKIIGIFTRLCVRDGKTHYLNYLPRVWAHFTHDLAHPILAPMRAFVDAHVPADKRGVLAVDSSIGGIVL